MDTEMLFGDMARITPQLFTNPFIQLQKQPSVAAAAVEDDILRYAFQRKRISTNLFR